jgi:peptidyl-prolyl cis-trans isomerase D
MFNLFRSRDKAVRILLGGLLGLVALSMLIYLIPGAGMPTTGSGNNEVIAEVGKETLTAQDIQRLVQERMAGRQIPPEMMQFMLPQLVDQSINDLAVAYEAKRMGFDVTDAQLANQLRAMPNLANLPADQYRMTIENLGYNVPQFENNMRKKMISLYLLNIALEGIVVTPQEIEQEYNRRNEKIKVDYIVFDPQKIKAEIKPTEQDLQAAFNATKSQYTMPETRSFRLVVADPAQISQTLQISDAQLQQYYNSHKDQFRTPERVKVRHILVMTTNKPKDEVDKLRKKADDLLKQIKGGADFAKLAQENSDDPGSKTKGGDLGWVVRGQTVKNFENTAFSLKPGQTSDVITTEYGFHIIQVQEKQDARLQPFDEVKTQIADDLKKGMVNDKTQNLADQARAEMAKAPQNSEQIANQLGLTFAKGGRLKSTDPMPIVGVEKGLADNIFTLKPGEVSPVMQGGNRLIIAVVDNVYPPHPAQFSDVETQVRDRFIMEQANKIVADRSKQAADMLKENGGDLKAVAKKFGAEVKSSDWFNRQGAVEGVGSASYFESGFTSPVGSSLGAVNTGNLTVVAKVVDRQNPDPAKLAQERDSILQQLKQKKAEERSLLFEDSILNRLVAEGKVKIHKDVINRIIARYRS